jgi:hypothetical protein
MPVTGPRRSSGLGEAIRARETDSALTKDWFETTVTAPGIDWLTYLMRVTSIVSTLAFGTKAMLSVRT